LRFLPFWQGFTSIPEGCLALSVLGEIERGAEPTVTIGLGPRLLGMKLSLLSVEQTGGFNKTVAEFRATVQRPLESTRIQPTPHRDRIMHRLQNHHAQTL